MKEFETVSECELLYYATGFLVDRMCGLKDALRSDDLSSKCRKDMEELLARYDLQYDELYPRFYSMIHQKDACYAAERCLYEKI